MEMMSGTVRSHDPRGHPMRNVIVTEFVSLDGVMEAPGGDEDFRHAGWTFDIETDDTMYG